MISLEVIATSAADCAVAETSGAQRIELCSALELGGLTPSLGLLLEARRATRLPILAMLRPRAGGFVYHGDECAAMQYDAEALFDSGADGLVLGALSADSTIDCALAERLLIIAAGRPVTFHRAFDFVPDAYAALDALIDLGIPRLLTSGHAATAEAGADEIARLVRRAAGRIHVMPGAGVCEANVESIVARTGCTEVHSSLSGRSDAQLHSNSVRLEGGAGSDGSYRILDGDRVRRMREILDGLESQQ